MIPDRRLAAALTLAVAASLGSEAEVWGQRLTVPEIAARGESTDVALHPELVETSVASLARAADAVVQGTAKFLRSRLSADGFYIYSEFSLESPAVVGWSRPLRRSSPMPEAVAFRQLGGSLAFNGVRVSMTSSALPLIPDGSHVIVFLREADRSELQSRYEIVNYVGALRVTDGRVEPLSPVHQRDDRIRGRSVEEVRHLIAGYRQPDAR